MFVFDTSLTSPKPKSGFHAPSFAAADTFTNTIDMAQSRAITPARKKTPVGDVLPSHMIRNPGYSYCPRTGVKVDDGKSLDEEYNLPYPPAFLFRPANGGPVFDYCFLTGLPVEEVTGSGGPYLPVTVGPNGKPLERIFCTGSGKFLGENCPYTGKPAAQATTKDGKLIAKTWDNVQVRAISHKFDVHTGVSLKGGSDPGAHTTSAKTPSSKKSKSQSARSNKSGPGSPLKPLRRIKYPAQPESHGKPATTKPKTKTKTKPAKPNAAAPKRPTRTRKEPERLIDETAAHPAVRKTTKKQAAPKSASAKTGAGVTKKKPATKKAPAKKAATTPKKAAAKKPAAAKQSKAGAGIKKTAAKKPKANTKRKIVPKKK